MISFRKIIFPPLAALLALSSAICQDRENPTPSPDSSLVAFTRGGDLFVSQAGGDGERRLTFDGSGLVRNGYASWVYYEEIFGRPSHYRAFWWSPDGKKIAFYRFDDTEVPMFPIYSPFGQDGKLSRTRYPKAGEPNPKVRIGFVDVADGGLVWADFDENEDQYFGTPFWGPDGRTLFVGREPRVQNMLTLYAVSSHDGSKKAVYHEESPTWLDWIDGMLFTSRGFYMARSFEGNWQDIYFLSYEGKLERLTRDSFWRIKFLEVDKKGRVLFSAHRGGSLAAAEYSLDRKGRIRELKPSQEKTSSGAEVVYITTSDSLRLPGLIVYPKDFDPTGKYPVHVDIYGGPDTPMVNLKRRIDPWWAENGIIELVADCRAAGHNGKRGLDSVYRRLGFYEERDFVEWGRWLQGLPFVDGEKIGVEGFSFGGTMAAALVMKHPDVFHYGIAGGGVYDWALYDTHYTERFMGTPESNPEGYASSRVISFVDDYPAVYPDSVGDAAAVAPVMLMLTHGTGDDNVHFQNTLQLVDALQRAGKAFELMIYPDALHGYRGPQHEHDEAAHHAFWLKYLK